MDLVNSSTASQQCFLSLFEQPKKNMNCIGRCRNKQHSVCGCVDTKLLCFMHSGYACQQAVNEPHRGPAKREMQFYLADRNATKLSCWAFSNYYWNK